MTLLRSLIIAGIAIAIARQLRGTLASPRLIERRFAWALLLAPYFTPMLLTGYAYANFSLSLIHHPLLNTIFYSALLCWKFTPVAAVVLHFTPAPISAEAIHCHRLNGPATPWREWMFLFRAGCARGPIAAFAIVFLLSYAEFEMASLMYVKSWTVALFDAHAGGLALRESLRRMLPSLLCEAVAVATAITMLGRARVAAKPDATNARGKSWFAWLYLTVSFLFVLGIPAGMVLWGTVRGFNLLLENFVLGREILSSLLFAAGATLLTWALVISLHSGARRQRMAGAISKAILLVALCLGLLGPLVLSLATLAAMQSPGLLSLRDTPVPLVLTLGLVFLPLGLVLKRVLELNGYRSALHLPALMGRSRAARELTWRLSTSGKFWAVMLVFVCAYWDLTASAILAPISMTPMTVRLYNMMHYGQIAALSAMTCAAFAAPIGIFLLAWVTRRWWAPS
jgi:ABC-type Fe3+ transport system permease subunit